MKGTLVIAILLVSSHVFAEDFEGKWKVPDAQTQQPAKCKAGDSKECLRLAWSAEAGIRGAGDTDVKRLDHAREWHAKACAIAKQKPCANADRVQQKLAAVKALKTDAERAQFWCGDALEGAARFADDSRTAPTVVAKACKVLLPKGFQKTLGAIAGTDPDMKSAMLLVGAQESICPTLASKPVSCTVAKDATKLSPAMRQKMLGMILKAALTGDAATRADELAGWLMK
jgi:hypothetical protein